MAKPDTDEEEGCWNKGGTAVEQSCSHTLTSIPHIVRAQEQENAKGTNREPKGLLILFSPEYIDYPNLICYTSNTRPLNYQSSEYSFINTVHNRETYKRIRNVWVGRWTGEKKKPVSTYESSLFWEIILWWYAEFTQYFCSCLHIKCSYFLSRWLTLSIAKV